MIVWRIAHALRRKVAAGKLFQTHCYRSDQSKFGTKTLTVIVIEFFSSQIFRDCLNHIPCPFKESLRIYFKVSSIYIISNSGRLHVLFPFDQKFSCVFQLKSVCVCVPHGSFDEYPSIETTYLFFLLVLLSLVVVVVVNNLFEIVLLVCRHYVDRRWCLQIGIYASNFHQI